MLSSQQLSSNRILYAIIIGLSIALIYLVGKPLLYSSSLKSFNKNFKNFDRNINNEEVIEENENETEEDIIMKFKSKKNNNKISKLNSQEIESESIKKEESRESSKKEKKKNRKQSSSSSLVLSTIIDDDKRPYCTLSDKHERYFPDSISERRDWPFGPNKDTTCKPWIDLNEDFQVKFLNDECMKYRDDVFKNFPVTLDNIMWNECEAFIQYCMLRFIKPHRVFEVGSGTSSHVTAYTLAELSKEEETNYKFTAIDIEPRRSLTDLSLKNNEHFKFDFIKSDITKIKMGTIVDELKAGDLFFIDSSHMMTHNSDVRFEFLDLVPRLRPGVFVHVHDMWQPCGDQRHPPWNEQEVVMLLLAFTDAFEVLWHGECMSQHYQPDITKLHNGKPCTDHSMWLRKIK